MSSSLSFVVLASNSSDYPENRPNLFRVRLAKPMRFPGSWMVALYQIQFPYSWDSTLGTLQDQWIVVNLKEESRIGYKQLHIPIPSSSHQTAKDLRDFLNTAIQQEASKHILARLRKRKRRHAFYSLSAKSIEGEETIETVPEKAKTEDDTLSTDGQKKKKEWRKVDSDADCMMKDNKYICKSKEPSPPKEGEVEAQEKEGGPVAEALVKDAGGDGQKPITRGQAFIDLLMGKRRQPEQKDEKAEETIPIPPQPQHTQQETPEADELQKQTTTKSFTTIDLLMGKRREPEQKEELEKIPEEKEEDTTSIPPQLQETPKAEELVQQKQSTTKTSTTTITEVSETVTTIEDDDKMQQKKSEEKEETVKEDKPVQVEETIATVETTQAPSPPENSNALKDAFGHEPKEGEKSRGQKFIELLTGEAKQPVAATTTTTISTQTEVEEKEATEEELPLLHEIANIIESVEFTYLGDLNRFKAHCTHPEISHLSMSKQLAYVLGFEQNDEVKDGEMAKYTCDLRGGFSSFVVYSRGLIEDVMVGNTMTSLLRIVSVEGQRHGSIIDKTFDSPMYISVQPREVSEIEIELRTMDGQLVPFHYGPVYVTLVFKRVLSL